MREFYLVQVMYRSRLRTFVALSQEEVNKIILSYPNGTLAKCLHVDAEEYGYTEGYISTDILRPLKDIINITPWGRINENTENYLEERR